MKNIWMILIALLFVLGVNGGAMADNTKILKELQALKERIEELEQKLEEQESLAKRQVAKTEKQIDEKVGEALEERFGALEIHGGAVLYYQGSRGRRARRRCTPTARAGPASPPTWSSPGSPRCRCWRTASSTPASTPATAAARTAPATATTTRSTCCSANLNTIADDNTGGSDTSLNLLEAHYTHEFFDKALNITGGKAKNLLFLDGNAFANNEKTAVRRQALRQQLGPGQRKRVHPAARGRSSSRPSCWRSRWSATSTSRPNVEGTPLEDTAKSKYDNVFSTPFIGSQLTLSPKFGELEGNYRLYGWWAGYNHSKLDSDRNAVAGRAEKGYGRGHQRRPAAEPR